MMVVHMATSWGIGHTKGGRLVKVQRFEKYDLSATLTRQEVIILLDAIKDSMPVITSDDLYLFLDSLQSALADSLSR